MTNAFTVGSNPYCVVAADVNGDGKIDLISANSLRNTLTVLTNNGSGSFGFNATLTVDNHGPGDGPVWVVAADVNGDGKIDLISANGGTSSTLTVLTNNGSGGFGSNATISVNIGAPGSGPVYVAAADVNGDDKLDLICANGDALTVLTNNGSGVFGSNATLTVSGGPVWVVAADVNGDGKNDLITANLTAGTLTVLTNNGSGRFGSDATLRVGSGPACVVAADINGNGKLDLICANKNDGTLTVLTNNGSGRFGSNATLTVGSGPECVIAADVYGNGKLDLITANLTAGTLTVLTNNGNGIFGFNATLTVGSGLSGGPKPVGSGPKCVVAADVNGDGRLDLICANEGEPLANTLTVLTQTIVGPPTLTITSTNSNSLVISWSSFSTGFALQTNSDLTTTNWVPASYTISNTSGTNESVTITPPPGNLFFRLMQ